MLSDRMTRWRNRAGLVLGGLSLALGLSLIDPLLEGEPFTLRGLAVDMLDKGLLVAVMFAAALLVMRLRQVEGETGRLRRDIDAARTAGAAWRRRSRPTVDELSAAISDQFERWSLTPAEADVAALMLKGAALKDIAELRRTSEATIRQQAGSVYRKSGLGNRAEFSAFFLEDLLADDPAPGAAGARLQVVEPARG